MRSSELNEGDLVTYPLVNRDTLFGLVLHIEIAPGIFRDSLGIEPVRMVTVLFDKDVPGYLGAGRIAKVTEMALCKVPRVDDKVIQ